MLEITNFRTNAPSD